MRRFVPHYIYHGSTVLPPLGLTLAALAVLSLALPCLGQTTPGSSDAGKANAIRVAGPLAAKEMMEELAVLFAKGKAPTEPAGKAILEYLRIDNAPSAASALLSGRDMILTSGKLAQGDVNHVKSEWKALAPQEYMLGAMSLAIVVHPRNNIDSLTMEQLQSIFSGKAADWKVFAGGEAKAIRRYSLSLPDPLAALFHEKALSLAKCAMLQRKKGSDEIMSALSSDPQGIGFVDAVAAMAAGDSIKIVAIGEGKSAISPNAQSAKDGSYPLSQVLVLYVSPKASLIANDFTQFLLNGQGDAVIRKHGFMPTLRAIRPDVSAAFEKLYGSDIKRVKATPDPADDLAMAGQLVQSARATKLDPAMLEAMCQSAYDLAAKVSGGRSLAFEAMDVLRAKVPDARFDCLSRRAALYQGAYESDKSRANAEGLIGALMAAADAGRSRQFAQAGEAWNKALAVAQESSSPQLGILKERLPAFAARAESLKRLDALSERLRADPSDVEARAGLLWLNVMELDDPAEAARFMDVARDEAVKTNIPLAAQPTDKLSEDAALTLAEWYVGLTSKAGVGGKELMAARARGCYLRFFALHKDREDALFARASLGLQKVNGTVPPPTPVASTQPKKALPPPPIPDDATDVKLAEFVAAHPDITRLGRQEIGNARLLTDLRPLMRLTKLTSLELQQAAGLKDLWPLGKMTNLTSLAITGLEVDNVSAISGLSNLTGLNISDARNVSDLSPAGGLVLLKTLNLSGCSKVTDLSPLSKLTALTSLTLSGCQGVASLAPLEKLARNLTLLSLNGCTKTNDVTGLGKLTRLKNLDVRNCDAISEGDLEWLRKHLPDCKILPAPASPAP